MNEPHFSAHLLLRRFHYFVISLAVTGGLAAAYFVYAPRTYESAVELLVIKKDPAMASVRTSRPSDGGTELVEDVLATQMRLLGSQQVLRDAIENHDLHTLPGVDAELDRDPKSRCDDVTLAVYYLEDQLSIRRGGEGQAENAQVLTARFRHVDPEETEMVLSAIVESYQDFLDRTFSGAGSEAFELFEQTRDRLASELEAAEAAQEQFLADAPVALSQAGSADLYARQLARLLETRDEIAANLRTAQSRLNILDEGQEELANESLAGIEQLALIDDAHVDRMGLFVSIGQGDSNSEEFQAEQPARIAKADAKFDRLVSMQAEAGHLRQKFGAQHPRLVQLASSIKQLEAAVADENHRVGQRGVEEAGDALTPEDVVRTYGLLLQKDVQHLEQRLKDLDERIDRTTRLVRESQKYSAKSAAIDFELDRKREVYSAVMARLPELGMTTKFSGFLTATIAPVSTAEVAWPKIPQLVALAGGLGVCAALAAIAVFAGGKQTGAGVAPTSA
ncbi:MAG: hypothetical protein AAGF97_16045 [Planctomycetota bacterium]